MPQLIRELDQLRQIRAGSVLTVGNFDGVHRGHANLIQRLVDKSREVQQLAAVMTFDPPPIALLAPDRVLPPPLTTIPQRAERLFRLGVDIVIAYPTNQTLLNLSPRAFFEAVIVREARASAMVEGPNFHFGKDRTGTPDILRSLAAEFQLDVEIVVPTNDPGGMISSTRIREYLRAGEIQTANALLTEPYQITGLVVAGEGRGRSLGFPTANLAEIQNFVPGPGVYAGASVIDSVEYPVAIHIGPNPTFDQVTPKVEVHVVGWSSDLYGRTLSCRIFRKIREIRKFASVDELRRQIRADIKSCAEIAQS